MSYKWEEFNIKTFPAETIVYRDGRFCPELSTIESGKITQNYDLPVHIIYVGKIAGKHRLKIDILPENQKVVLTVKIENEKPAFFNIFIKNTGKNSELNGHVMLKNNADLNFDLIAHHAAPDTTVLVKTKLIAGAGSTSVLSGAAKIDRNSKNAVSDIGFSALADETAKITFKPAQFIKSIPLSAEHGAAIYRPTTPQIEFLNRAGLTAYQANEILRDAFLNSD